MTVDGKLFKKRKDAGSLLLKHVLKAKTEKPFQPRLIGAIGGFDLRLAKGVFGYPALGIARTGWHEAVETDGELTALGLISRLEHLPTRFEAELKENNATIAQAESWIPSLETRLGVSFAFQDELDDKRAELATINESLAATKAEDEADVSANAA